jgi:hypothetical protein
MHGSHRGVLGGGIAGVWATRLVLAYAMARLHGVVELSAFMVLWIESRPARGESVVAAGRAT